MLRAGLCFLLLATGAVIAAEPPPVRLLFAVGSNVGDPEDVPLRYAAEDARRVADLFQGIGGVTSDRAYLLLDAPEDVVRERFSELAGRVAELARVGRRVEVLVYVSAHARAGVLHLHGTHLPLDRLRRLTEQTAAHVRTLIIDACDSGAAARPKGGKPGPEYDVSLEKLPLAGTVLITSSGPAEPSQEWESLGGSLFTHHLLTGLRGDADGDADGRVTLAEAYGYAYRRTVLEAVSRAQHPAFDVDLSGTGELVLTEPRASRSALLFPAELEGRYVVASQPRPDIVAEVDKQLGRPLRLAVPPGRYSVRKRMQRMTGLITVELPYGGEVPVSEAGMVKRSFTEVAIKGGVLELHPWSVLVLGQVETTPVPGTGARWRVGAGVRWTHGEWWVQGALLWGMDEYRGQALLVTEHALALQASGGYRWLLTPVTPFLGMSVQVTGYRQTFLRDEEQRIQEELGLGPLPPALTLGVAFGPVVGVEVPLWRGLYLRAAVGGQARYLSVSSRPPWSLAGDASLGLGWIF